MKRSDLCRESIIKHLRETAPQRHTVGDLDRAIDWSDESIRQRLDEIDNPHIREEIIGGNRALYYQRKSARERAAEVARRYVDGFTYFSMRAAIILLMLGSLALLIGILFDNVAIQRVGRLFILTDAIGALYVTVLWWLFKYTHGLDETGLD